MVPIASLVCALIFFLVLGSGIYLFVAGKRKSLNVGLFVFGVIGVGCLGLGGIIAWDRLRFFQRASSVWGEVVDTGESKSQDKDGAWVTTYAPRVRFVTPQERVVEFIGPVRNSRGYEPGQSVVVLYLPESPEKSARIKGFDLAWLAVAMLLVFGGVFGGIVLREGFRKENTEEANGPRSVSSRNRRKAAIQPPPTE